MNTNNADMKKEEREAIQQAQYIYSLDDSSQQKREYTDEETQKIDDVDLIRAKMKAKKRAQTEALAEFRR